MAKEKKQTDEKKADKDKKKQALLEAKALMGELLLQEKQYQSMLQQLAPKINASILRVQNLT